MFEVHEVTWHGDFRAERTVTLPDLSAASVARMMQECPYAYCVPLHRAARIAAELTVQKRADHGWTTWTTS